MSNETLVIYYDLPGYRLKKAQMALRQRMDENLRAQGITTPQYAAMVALERYPGLSNAALARLAFVTPQTMLGIVQNLEREELITRTEDPAHGRILQTTLTPRGRAIIHEAIDKTAETTQQMVKDFSAEEVELFNNMLDRCVRNLSGS